MPARNASRRSRVVAQLALLAVVSAAVLVLSGNSTAGPESPAHAETARVAAQRMMLPITLDAASTGVDRFALIDGAAFVAHPGGATRVRVPALGIDAEVRPVGLVFRDGKLQYDTPTVEAGQYAGTADPGTFGNTVIGGHVALRGGAGVFTTLPNVKVGALVEVESGATAFRYQVIEVRMVAPDATEVMAQTQDATLTLITCSEDGARAKRVVVIGKLV
jgi:LPXTG-site transpeptidase (sortase) family protein